MNCANCLRPMSLEGSNDELRRRGMVRRSKQGGRNFCVECVYPLVSAQHRYCVCAGYHRDPSCPWQCQFCYRRINPALDHEVAA
jgi:hypothetical protein